MKIKLCSSVIVTVLAIGAWAGCGTTANLAGLSASVNVAQKGAVVGATFTGGTNSVTVGATYASGTNTIGGIITVP